MERITNIEELRSAVMKAEGYLVSVTIIEQGVLQHFLLTEKFPFVDMLRSHAQVKDLIIAKLEDTTKTPELLQ